MNALLRRNIAPSFSFRIDCPEQTAQLALRGEAFDFELTFFKQHLRFSLGETHAAHDRQFEVGLVPAASYEEYHLSFERNVAGVALLVLRRHNTLLFSLECSFGFDRSFTLETNNVTLTWMQRRENVFSGLVSAPDNRNNLVLVHAAEGYRRSICGALEENMPYTTHVRILVETDEDEDALQGPTIPRDGLIEHIRTRFGSAIANVSLVAITNPESMDPDEIASVINQCAVSTTQMFLGGVVQKMPVEELSGLSDTSVPQLVSNHTTQPVIAFAADSWSETVPENLRGGFQRYVPETLKTIRPGMSARAALPRYRIDSALWAVNRFWFLDKWIAPAEGSFNISWVLQTVFARNGAHPSDVLNLLRSTCERCKAENIRVLGCQLIGAEKPTYLLIDVTLMELACDASYARSRRPLETYLAAIDYKACVTQTIETDTMQITLLHMKREHGSTEDAALAELLEATREALEASTENSVVSQPAESYLTAVHDAVSVASLINAVATDQASDVAPETLLRFLKTHPQLTVLLLRHVLMLAPPSKISGYMAAFGSSELNLSEEDEKDLLKLLIETRLFPVSDEKLWTNLPEQPYGDRRWAALQLLEQLPTADYKARAPGVLKQLDLAEEDLTFNQVLALLKEGNLELAVARGCEAVLRGKLRPENERDMLAIALLAEDFNTAKAIEDALAEPLSELDIAYRDGVVAARKGKFSTKKRQRCTKDILALDEEFVDLRIRGRKYETIAEFASEPDPERDVICVITAKNEESRLRETLAHHHAIGLRHFILIDNMSSDGTLDIARDYGAKIIQTAESYKESRYGMAWVNDVLDAYCTGFWSLVVDADEMFIFPEAETRSIQDFTAMLDAEGYDAFGCALLDMYPEAPISSFKDVPRGELRSLYRYFDGQNAAFWPRLRSPLLGLSGGVRDRAFRMGRFAHLAPIAQTKTPLVKWAAGMKYLTSTHDITPVRSPVFFGALEHYKYTPDFVERAKREVIRKEHWGGGSEYTAYATVLEADPDMSFIDARFSHEREKSTQLIQTVCPFPWPEEML
ncbi:glycosyltransferase family 2 protein [Shimia sp.]|uniref:glycosyltransferase family 2 protein n=1 Tax=Shimia sp. TaxID=1954381 RepID=UPI003297F634